VGGKCRGGYDSTRQTFAPNASSPSGWNLAQATPARSPRSDRAPPRSDTLGDEDLVRDRLLRRGVLTPVGPDRFAVAMEHVQHGHLRLFRRPAVVIPVIYVLAAEDKSRSRRQPRPSAKARTRGSGDFAAANAAVGDLAAASAR
jgi:hypothetical protein